MQEFLTTYGTFSFMHGGTISRFGRYCYRVCPLHFDIVDVGEKSLPREGFLRLYAEFLNE